MSGQQHGIGVDIGGTKIAAGLVDEAGHLLRSESVPTPKEADDISLAVASLVEQLSADGAVSGVGIGAAGFVDIDRSTVIFAPNIDWRDEPLGRDVARHTGLPVVVENDAHAGADRDEEEVVGVLAGAEAELAPGRCVGVVLDHHRQTGVAGDVAPERLVAPVDVGGEDDRGPVDVDEARRADADAAHGTVGRQLLHQVGDRDGDVVGLL
ncbi:MAG: ROK family protein, partial [Actinomycetales bacterium]